MARIEGPVDSHALWDALHGFIKTEVVFQAVKYDVFERLSSSGRAMSTAELAEGQEVNLPAFERLLNTCATLGLLRPSNGENCALYSNTEASQAYLTRSSSTSILAIVGSLQHAVRPSFQLDISIKTGKMVRDIMPIRRDLSPDEYITAVFGSKPMFLSFVDSMEAQASTSVHIFKNLDLSKYTHIVDLGGCGGTHARALKNLYPDKKITIADIPPVVAEAQSRPANVQAAIEFAPCDFFTGSTLPSGDLFILSHVIHDWTDEQALLILSNVFGVINKGGSVLIMEKILNKDKAGPPFASYQDLVLLNMTAGRERTETELKALIQKAGFSNIRIKSFDNSPFYDAIFADKL